MYHRLLRVDCPFVERCITPRCNVCVGRSAFPTFAFIPVTLNALFPRYVVVITLRVYRYAFAFCVTVIVYSYVYVTLRVYVLRCFDYRCSLYYVALLRFVTFRAFVVRVRVYDVDRYVVDCCVDRYVCCGSHALLLRSPCLPLQLFVYPRSLHTLLIRLIYHIDNALFTRTRCTHTPLRLRFDFTTTRSRFRLLRLTLHGFPLRAICVTFVTCAHVTLR